MNSFINLLRNEHMKLYKKVSTYIMMGLLVLIIITAGVLVKISDNMSAVKNENSWKNDYQYQIDSNQEKLKDNKLSTQQKTELQTQIEFNKYSIENNINNTSWKSEAVMELITMKNQMQALVGLPSYKEFEAKYVTLEEIIKNNDWKRFLSNKKIIINSMLNDKSLDEATRWMYKVTIASIDMRLKYNISPDSDSWKNSDIKSIEEKKITLLQLENSSGKNLSPDSAENAKSLEQNKKTLSNQVKMAEYRIVNNIAPTDLSGTQWDFMNSLVGNMINIIVVFVVIICSGIVAGEFSDGTIKIMLIRPYKRWEILLAKYLTVFVYTLEIMAVLIISSYITSGIMNGFSSPGTFLYMNGSDVTEQGFVLRMLFETALNIVPLVMVATMTFMISTVFKNAGLSIGISLLLLFIGGTIVQVLAISLKYTWTKYILFTNWNIVHYFTEGVGPLVEGMTLAFSIIVLMVYFILFNLVTFFTFTKRDVTT